MRKREIFFHKISFSDSNEKHLHREKFIDFLDFGTDYCKIDSLFGSPTYTVRLLHITGTKNTIFSLYKEGDSKIIEKIRDYVINNKEFKDEIIGIRKKFY